MIINPMLPYIPPYKPLSNITPFTYRDALTNADVLAGLREYLNKVIDFVNTNFTGLGDTFEGQVNLIISTVNAKIDEIEAGFTEQNATVDAANASHSAAVQTLMTQLQTDVTTAINQVLNDSVEVQDAVVALAFGDDTSDVRGVVDALYAPASLAGTVSTVDSNLTTLGTTVDTLDERVSKSNLNAAFVQHVNTVAELTTLDTELGNIVNTMGYHNVNDGGASSYTVIEAATEPYDIVGDGVAYRPVASRDIINPKMFGTLNNGVATDNVALQSCFDFARDFNVATIDGLGLDYLIGSETPYDTSELWPNTWQHKGVCVDAGRTVTNFNFKVAPGSTNGTSALAVKLIEGAAPTRIINSTIDGNKDALTINSAITREDGGCHGIHLWHPLIDTSARDFYPAGNVYIDNVKFKNIYSYGGRLDHADCLVELRNCEFDVSGIAFQAHATRFNVIGGRVTSSAPRPGMVADIFHEEAEFSGNYTGTKKQSISIDGVEINSVGANEKAVFKVHYSPMQNVAWTSVSVTNCNVTSELVNLVEFYNSSSTLLTVDDLRITGNRCQTVARALKAVATASGRIRFESLNINGRNRATNIVAENTSGGNWNVTDCTFSATARISFSGSNVYSVKFDNCSALALGAQGVFNDSVVINMLVVEGGEYTSSAACPFIFSGNFTRAKLRDFTVNADANAMGTLIRTLATSTYIEVRDVLLSAAAYRADGSVVTASGATNGLVYLNNVRHLTSIATPVIIGGSLAANRKVIANSANLY